MLSKENKLYKITFSTHWSDPDCKSFTRLQIATEEEMENKIMPIFEEKYRVHSILGKENHRKVYYDAIDSLEGYNGNNFAIVVVENPNALKMRAIEKVVEDVEKLEKQ